MRRVIGPSADAPARLSVTALPPDTYQSRLLKYIPADLVALYLTLKSTAAAAGTAVPQVPVQWIVFLVLLLITPFYVLKVTKVAGAAPAKRQALISTGAFIVWVFALGGPFAALGWYHVVYGALLLPLYTVLVPLIGGDPL